jgi:hypothetical protein
MKPDISGYQGFKVIHVLFWGEQHGSRAIKQKKIVKKICTEGQHCHSS